MTLELVGIFVLIGFISGYSIIQSHFSSVRLKQILLESKIDALLQHSLVEYDHFSPFSKEVKINIKNGNTIEAAKIVRVTYGVGLKEAMDIVNNLNSYKN